MAGEKKIPVLLVKLVMLIFYCKYLIIPPLRVAYVRIP